jgi:hypothetical protein
MERAHQIPVTAAESAVAHVTLFCFGGLSSSKSGAVPAASRSCTCVGLFWWGDRNVHAMSCIQVNTSLPSSNLLSHAATRSFRFASTCFRSASND